MTETPSPAGGRILIVGGGAIGLSIAHHLLDAGHEEVAVLEQAEIGSGTSSAGTGGIRQQFTSEINVRLVRDSIPEFLTLGERTGMPFEFRQHGYLFLADSEERLASLEKSAALQRTLGVECEIIAPDRIADVAPDVELDGVLGGSYSPQDGSAITQEAVAAWEAALRRSRVQIHEGVRVLDFRRSPSGRVVGVSTSAGSFDADTVIIAAGVWSRGLGRMLGLDIPVSPRSRQAFEILSEDVDLGTPLTVDLGTGAYVHPKSSRRVLIGGNDREVPESQRPALDPERIPSLLSAIARRFPKYAGIAPSRGWAGLREMTPDDHAIVGPTGVAGVWVATGFSGHGFMQAPAIGRILSELLLEGRSDTDLGPLRPERFAEQVSLHEGIRF
ncbi:FAD-binding oxidoreductase [Leucobacter sp. wl10]|uniref:NAD(P)/FAD-dependent oxidoreductase n=1 Tax=Leucobacter sp. wl10 TaxID=2304677 RepID=UPI0013C305E9|nr:FAD-dependent oxidoreductase [Leucobacter sp. wl10]